MKRILALVFIIGTFVAHTFAQKSDFKEEWSVGVGGGMTMSSVSFDPTVQVKNINRAFGGVAVRFISQKNLGMIAELNYAQQGWEGKFENNPELMHRHKLNYLELPLLTHIYFGNKVRFFVNLGPKFSYLLSDSEEMNDAMKEYLASYDPLRPNNERVGQYYRSAEKKFDYGLLAGLGLEFRTGIGHFSLEGRYSLGLGDVFRNSSADHFNRSANRVMGVKLTYYINISKGK